MAEIIEPMVHKKNTDSTHNNGDSISVIENMDVSSHPDNTVSAGHNIGDSIVTDKKLAKDLIKEARKEGLGLTGPGGLFNSVN